MNRYLAIGYIDCLVCGVVLGFWLLFQDIRTQSRWVRAVDIFFSVAQIASIVLAIVALAITLNPSIQLHWVDLAIACTLQSIVNTNLARFLRLLSFPTWATMLSYTAVVIISVVYVIFYRYKLNTRILYPILLLVLAAGPVLSACLSCWRFRQHQNSGQRPLSQPYLSLLRAFIATNAVAALFGICGGLLLFFPPPTIPRNLLHDSIFLACIVTQLVCTLSFCSGTITCRIVDPIRAHQATRCPNTSNTESIELVEHRGNPTL